MSATHNGSFVQSAPAKKPTPVGFFVPAGHQYARFWTTIFAARGQSVTSFKEDTVSLPITARQLNALRALQRTDPDLGDLAKAVVLAFDASTIDNPELARLILEKTCRRIVAGEPGSHEAMILHLERFGELNCLSPAQVTDFTDRIRKLA